MSADVQLGEFHVAAAALKLNLLSPTVLASLEQLCCPSGPTEQWCRKAKVKVGLDGCSFSWSEDHNWKLENDEMDAEAVSDAIEDQENLM